VIDGKAVAAQIRAEVAATVKLLKERHGKVSGGSAPFGAVPHATARTDPSGNDCPSVCHSPLAGDTLAAHTTAPHTPPLPANGRCPAWRSSSWGSARTRRRTCE
jgi:hypothetical protein